MLELVLPNRCITKLIPGQRRIFGEAAVAVFPPINLKARSWVKKNCDKENQPKGGSKIMRILVLGIRHIVQKRQRHKKIYHPKVPPFIVIRRFLKSRSVHAATGLKRVDRQPIEQQPFRNMVIKAAYNSTPLFLCW